MNYPRVTQILAPFTSYDRVPKQTLENAAARGTSVHAYCAEIAKGIWVPSKMINEECKGYVDSFQQWVDAQVEEFLVIEKRYADEDHKFTGQIDCLIRAHNGETYLVDLKTCAKPNKTHALQVAAYEHILRKHGYATAASMIVYLKRDGEFPDIDFREDLSEELRIFFAATECWHYFNRGKNDKAA
jgi:hypothetical protein